MTNIDLLAAMFGPILAGFILEVVGALGSGKEDAYTTTLGFGVVAILNA